MRRPCERYALNTIKKHFYWLWNECDGFHIFCYLFPPNSCLFNCSHMGTMCITGMQTAQNKFRLDFSSRKNTNRNEHETRAKPKCTSTYYSWFILLYRKWWSVALWSLDLLWTFHWQYSQYFWCGEHQNKSSHVFLLSTIIVSKTNKNCNEQKKNTNVAHYTT